ncbi:MAG TPA: protein tyrosine phosphatase [Myxococcales bacterium]|jgi:hypothetical protein
MGPAPNTSILVRDALPGEAPPRRFRTADQPLALSGGAVPPDARGLRELRASASAQFTAEGLAWLLRDGPVWVVDLRQESHGFIDGLPVSFYAERNWGNRGRSREEAAADERRRLSELAAADEVTFAALKKDAGRGSEPPSMHVGRVQDEQELVEASGARYLRLFVSDHLRPDDGEVERFIAAMAVLPAGARVHIHCRGGKGRSSTFLALYDILRNGTVVALDDILARQRLLSGYDLARVGAVTDWKAVYRQERAAFIASFYGYVRAGARLPFGAWAAGSNASLDGGK